MGSACEQRSIDMLTNRKIVLSESCDYFYLQFNSPVRSGLGQTGHQKGNTMQSAAIGMTSTGQLEKMMDGQRPQAEDRPPAKPSPVVTARGSLPAPAGRSERTPGNLHTQFTQPQARQPGPVAEAIFASGSGPFVFEQTSEPQQYSYRPWIKPAAAVGVGVFAGLTAFLIWRKLTSQDHAAPQPPEFN